MKRSRFAVTVVLSLVLVMVFCAQVFASQSDQLSGYTYYDGTPGNLGPVNPNIETERVMNRNSQTIILYVNGEIAENRWVAMQVQGLDRIDWWYFGENGKAQNDWFQLDGNWYYLRGGWAAVGWNRIDQKYYYFDPVTCIMKNSGTEMRDGVEYEFEPNGESKIVNGLLDAGENGTEGWKKEGENYYYLRGGQKVTNEWLVNGKDRYYAGADGARYTGIHEIDGILYVFRLNGVLYQDTYTYLEDYKYIMDAEGHAVATAMSAEEAMEYSNEMDWFEDTYSIYSESQEIAELAAKLKNISLPSTQELLARDWGITEKEPCVTMIQSLADAGRTASAKSDKAWNFSRAMMLCETMEQIGWITKAERLDMQLAIAPDIQKSFSSWQEYNEAYMTGYRAWSTNAQASAVREQAYDNAKKYFDSIFRTDWNWPLNKIW